MKLDLVGRFISNEIMKSMSKAKSIKDTHRLMALFSSDVTDLSYRTQLSLDHGRQKTWIREDGSFTM